MIYDAIITVACDGDLCGEKIELELTHAGTVDLRSWVRDEMPGRGWINGPLPGEHFCSEECRGREGWRRLKHLHGIGREGPALDDIRRAMPTDAEWGRMYRRSDHG